MYQDLARKAIQAALSQNWETATSINQEILQKNPQDIDALNRISQAYMRRGLFGKATKASEKVKNIDPLNTIANKCQERCEALKGKKVLESRIGDLKRLQNLFIEIPGHTRIVSLINICEASSLATLNPGQEVMMQPRQRRVVITTIEDDYIGKIPDDLSIRIISFYDEGREYKSHIKSVNRADVKIFIRDISPGYEVFQERSFLPKKY